MLMIDLWHSNIFIDSKYTEKRIY